MKLKSKAILLLLISATFSTTAALAEEPIQPIKPVQNINLAQVELGKKLYFDPRRRSRALSPATPATT